VAEADDIELLSQLRVRVAATGFRLRRAWLTGKTANATFLRVQQRHEVTP